MILVINGQLPTLNKYIDAERSNRYIAAKIKREATDLVALQCKQMKVITERGDYLFTWFVKDKRTDPDNIAFAAKFVLDGLQTAGKLPKDSMAWVRSITHRFEIGEPRVELTITAADV